MNIDKTDRQILMALLDDSRSSVSGLAKKTGLSREIINYRMKRLEDDNIIKNYITIIHQPLFCSGIATLLCKLRHIADKRSDEIYSFINDHPSINWCSELCGSYDIVVTFLYADSQDLEKSLSSITNYLGKDLKEHSLSLYISEYKFDRKPLIAGKSSEYRPKIVHFDDSKIDIDEIDRRILSELANNSRIKNIDLAKKIKISEDSTRLRIKRLEDKKIIKGYTIVLDTGKLGFEAYYMGLQIENINDKTINKIKYYVNTNQYIIFCARTSGKYNIIMTLNTKNRTHFSELLLEIRRQFSEDLNGYEFQIILQDHKEIFVPKNLILKNF